MGLPPEGVFIEDSRWVCPGHGLGVGQTGMALDTIVPAWQLYGVSDNDEDFQRKATEGGQRPWPGVAVRAEDEVLRVVGKEALEKLEPC